MAATASATAPEPRTAMKNGAARRPSPRPSKPSKPRPDELTVEEAQAELEAAGHDTETFADAVEAYGRALTDLKVVRDAWEKLGRPVITYGGRDGALELAHPLLGEVRAAERHAATLRTALLLDPKSRAAAGAKRPSGRPLGSASAPDRKPAEPPRLRMVQS